MTEGRTVRRSASRGWRVAIIAAVSLLTIAIVVEGITQLLAPRGSHGSAAGYLVAHSSTIDFIGPNGRIRGLGDWSDTADELAAKAKRAES